jgi:hypothetical protein
MTDARRTDDRGQRAVRQDTRGDRRGMLFSGETEARPGIMTSEFWLTLLAAEDAYIQAAMLDIGPSGP